MHYKHELNNFHAIIQVHISVHFIFIKHHSMILIYISFLYAIISPFIFVTYLNLFDYNIRRWSGINRNYIRVYESESFIDMATYYVGHILYKLYTKFFFSNFSCDREIPYQKVYRRIQFYQWWVLSYN